MRKFLIVVFILIGTHSFSQNDSASSSAQLELKVPKFKSLKVQRMVGEVVTYLNEVVVLMQSGSIDDMAKDQEWINKYNQCTIKLKEISKLVSSSPKEAKKWANFNYNVYTYMLYNEKKFFKPKAEIIDTVKTVDWKNIDTANLHTLVPKFDDPELQKVAYEFVDIEKELIRISNQSPTSYSEEKYQQKTQEYANKIESELKKIDHSSVDFVRFHDFLQNLILSTNKYRYPATYNNK